LNHRPHRAIHVPLLALALEDVFGERRERHCSRRKGQARKTKVDDGGADAGAGGRGEVDDGVARAGAGTGPLDRMRGDEDLPFVEIPMLGPSANDSLRKRDNLKGSIREKTREAIRVSPQTRSSLRHSQEPKRPGRRHPLPQPSRGSSRTGKPPGRHRHGPRRSRRSAASR
jgi:hypothetical protein